MPRYIDADLIPWTDIAEGTPMKKPIKVLITFADKINRMPTADVRENVRGKWVSNDHNEHYGNISTCVYYYPTCSCCGHSGDYNMNFCPNCGADMRGE